VKEYLLERRHNPYFKREQLHSLKDVTGKISYDNYDEEALIKGLRISLENEERLVD